MDEAKKQLLNGTKEEIYTPCNNCKKRLQLIELHIQKLYNVTDFSYIPGLFRDVYLHCPGVGPRAFAKFTGEKITKLLEAHAQRCSPLLDDIDKVNRMMQTQGQLAELATRLLDITTRQELTFIMFQANVIGTNLFDMNSYENYERLVSGRVWELDDGNADDVPNSIYFVLDDYPKLVAELKENEQGLLELAAYIDAKHKIIDTFQRSVISMSAQIDGLEKTVFKKDTLIDQLKKTVSNNEAYHQEEQNTIKLLRNIIADRDAEILQKATIPKGLKQTVENYHAESCAQSRRISTLQCDNSNMEAKLKELQADNADKDAQIAKLQSTVDKVQHLIGNQ